MKSQFLVTAFAAFTLALAGCTKQDNQSVHLPETSKEAATQVEEAFAEADVEVKKESQRLAESMRQRKYEEALGALNALSAQQAQNEQQVIAVENANRRFQADLLEAVEAGDENAIKIWNRMKGRRRN